MQLKPKISPLNTCIEEEVKNNVVDINQIQPVQSELIQKSSSCLSNDANNLAPNALPETPTTTKLPNDSTSLPNEEIDIIPETTSTPVPEVFTPEDPNTDTTEGTSTSTTLSNEPESGSNDEDDSHS